MEGNGSSMQGDGSRRGFRGNGTGGYRNSQSEAFARGVFSDLIRGMVVVATLVVEEEVFMGAVAMFHGVGDSVARTDSQTLEGS
jgi:hypothetical protein